MNPDACCKSRPVGETKFPVARKLASFAPMSKLTFEIAFLMYLSATKSVYFEVDVNEDMDKLSKKFTATFP